MGDCSWTLCSLCVEIDLDKPLVASYRLRGREGKLQYEGLHDLCFMCGKYGHKEIMCPRTVTQSKPQTEEEGRPETRNDGASKNSNNQPKSVFGPWMVAQRARRRQPKLQKGSSIIQGEWATWIWIEEVQGGATETNRMKPKTGGNGQAGHGSRFGVLSDQSEIDVDTGVSAEKVGIDSNPMEKQEGAAIGEEVVMETLDMEEKSGSRVNLSVSHLGLADKLRPLGGTKTNIRTQAQREAMGPKKTIGRVFKELTTKLEVRPTIAKQ